MLNVRLRKGLFSGIGHCTNDRRGPLLGAFFDEGGVVDEDADVAAESTSQSS